MSARPFSHLCPEADERDAMTDGEFWERVAHNLGVNTEHFDDFDGPDLDAAVNVGTCETCGASGACGYDAEGRALIHADTDPDGYERCIHEWICRPESDTWFCEWCGEES